MVPTKLALFSPKGKEQNLKNAACAQQLLLTSPALVLKEENGFGVFLSSLPTPLQFLAC